MCVIYRSPSSSYNFVGYTHPKTEMEYTVTNSESKILVISDSELERATPLAQEHGLELLVLHEKEFPSYEKPTETCYEDENFGEDDYIDKPALIIYTRYPQPIITLIRI